MVSEENMKPVGAAPELDRYEDDELARHLLELARELLSRHAPIGSGES
jgi:hypothetical protein